jgi:hypothetical protein
MPNHQLQPVAIREGLAQILQRSTLWVADAANDPTALLQQLEELDDTEGGATASAIASAIEWTEKDVVELHCLLLLDVGELANPRTPLAEKLDTLRWIYTDRDKDRLPFSFANCLFVAGCSPLSIFDYFGFIHPDDFRDYIRWFVRRCMRETLDRYPHWVGDAFRRDPHWFALRLEKKPQWLNQQVKRVTEQGDLFV